MAPSNKSLAPLIFLVVAVFASSLAFAGSGEPVHYHPTVLGDFQVGNLNDPVGPPVPGIFMGEEAYAYHIYPADQCDCSQEGFQLESVSQFLFFDDQQFPLTLEVQGALLKADFDAANDCFVPGPLLHEGPIETVIVQDNGTAVIQANTPDCPGFPLEDHYFLVMRYFGGAEAQLVVDDQPQPCTEYINRGNGWFDLFDRDKSGGGKVIVFGDIVCSPLSIGNTTTSWDGIKSLYK